MNQTGRERVAHFLTALGRTGELNDRLAALYANWKGSLDRDDFFDAVLSTAWVRADNFSGTTLETFLGWLRRVSWTVALDLLRNEARERARRSGWSLMHIDALSEHENQLRTIETVAWLLAGLTFRERVVMRERFFFGRNTTQIAQLLGTTVSAVHQLHYRALKRLRERARNYDQNAR